MKTLHTPFEVLTEAMDQGLQHALYTLELAERPEKTRKSSSDKITKDSSPDLEAKGDMIEPGDQGFADSLKTWIECFYDQRKSTLNTWCVEHKIDLKRAQDNAAGYSESAFGMEESAHDRHQRQLYLILYVSRTGSSPLFFIDGLIVAVSKDVVFAG